MHIYGIYKDDIDEPIGRAAMEKQTTNGQGLGTGRRG